MPRLFRKTFLEHVRQESNDLVFAPPERQLTLFWPTLLILSFWLVALLTWFFFAMLPIKLEARGVALPLGGVREVHAYSKGVMSGQPTPLDDTLLDGGVFWISSTPQAPAG